MGGLIRESYLTLATAARIRAVIRILLTDGDLLPHLITRIVEHTAIVRVARGPIAVCLLHKHIIAVKDIDCPRLLFA